MPNLRSQIWIGLLMACHVSSFTGLATTVSSAGATAGTQAALYAAPSSVTFNFYAAPWGNDGQACTSLATACASLNGVRARMNGKTGQSACFKGGFYQNQATAFTSTDSGASGAPNVYTNCPGETPVLSAGWIVTGWAKSTSGDCAGISNCYQVTLPQALGGVKVGNFEGLWYNGVRRPRARNVAQYHSGLPQSSGYQYAAAGNCSTATTLSAAENPAQTAATFSSLTNLPGSWVVNNPVTISGYAAVPAFNGTFTITGVTSKSFTVGNTSAAASATDTGGSAYECQPSNAFQFQLQGSNSAPDVRPSYYNSLDVEAVVFVSWIVQRCRIASVSGANIVTCSSKITDGYNFDYTGNAQGGVKYLIENSREDFLANAAPGTWYLDCGASNPCATDISHSGIWTLSYIATATEDPTTALIVVGNQPQIMTGFKVSNLTFNGLNFFAPGNYTVPVGNPTSYIGAVTGETEAAGEFAFVDGSNITFSANVIHGGNEPAIDLYSDQTASNIGGHQVTGNLFYDLGGSAVRLGRSPVNADTAGNTLGNNWLVQNNFMIGLQRFIGGGGSGCIVLMQGHDGKIDHNECADTYSGGINFGQSTGSKFVACGAGSTPSCIFNVQVTNNLLHDMDHGVTVDGGWIHLGFNANTGNVVQGNVAHDIIGDTVSPYTPGFANGLYIDNQVQNALVQNNLTYNTSGPLYTNNGSANPCGTGAPPSTCNNLVKNNIFAFSPWGCVRRGLGNPNNTWRTFDYTNNICILDQPGATAQAVSSITGGNFWGCNGQTDYPYPCTNFYNFASDIWYSSAGTLTFISTDPDHNNAITNWNLAGAGCGTPPASWQAGGSCPGEDAGSIQTNPLFNNPGWHDFSFSAAGNPATPGTPANQIGFTDFTNTWRTAGRTSFTLAAPSPAAPQTFPNQPITSF